jgi:hypothetical protein
MALAAEKVSNVRINTSRRLCSAFWLACCLGLVAQCPLRIGAFQVASNQQLRVTKPLELTVSWATPFDSVYCSIILAFDGYLLAFFHFLTLLFLKSVRCSNRHSLLESHRLYKDLSGDLIAWILQEHERLV